MSCTGGISGGFTQFAFKRALYLGTLQFHLALSLKVKLALVGGRALYRAYVAILAACIRMHPTHQGQTIPHPEFFLTRMIDNKEIMQNDDYMISIWLC